MNESHQGNSERFAWLHPFFQQFEAAGFSLYLVGGAVRDAWLGEPLQDYDFATSATPAQMRAFLGSQVVEEQGQRFGTLGIRWKGHVFEVTTFREESAYKDGRHPSQVRFADTPEADLRRRDFTMNAMAWRPGEWLDPYGGRADLAARRLRTVGNPQVRFAEDALRLLRAVRFAARYELCLDAPLQQALRDQSALLANVAPERCFLELDRLVQTATWQRGRNLLQESGLAALLFPEGWSPARSFAPIPPQRAVRWALFLWEMPSVKILERLSADRALRKAVAHLAAQPPLEAMTMDLPAVRRRLGAWPEGAATLDAYLQAQAVTPKTIEAYQQWRKALCEIQQKSLAIRRRDLALSGRDLLQLGYLEGKQIGWLLAQLEEAVLDGRVENTRSALLHQVQFILKRVEDEDE